MPGEKRVSTFSIPGETLADKAGTWLGAVLIGLEGVGLAGVLIAFGLGSAADFAYLTFSLVLASTMARHIIRIDRAEESDNYEEISLKDRWHFAVPKQLPPRDDA